MSEATDLRLMDEALDLAERARFIATPNPYVGCVVAVGDDVIGRGWTQAYGSFHAEQHALANCTCDPRGATAYVTLEPCNTVGPSGRASSCVDSLLEAGIARVVCAREDPNPQMSGTSIERLRARGVRVDVGVGAAAASQHNLGFASRMTRGRPWLRVKMAASLDGRSALVDGTSQWITGPAARDDGHRWRAQACAVLTGVGTILNDDPQLTVRAVPTTRQPRRIIVDRRGRTPPAARIFAGDDPVWLFCAEPPIAALPPHVEVVVLPDAVGRVDLVAMMDELGRRRINEVQVEAGAKLAGALVAQHLVDELLIYVAPCLLGDAARGLFALPPLVALDERIPLEIREIVPIGADWRITARVKD